MESGTLVIRLSSFWLAAAVMLAACSGGGSGDPQQPVVPPPPPPPPPTSPPGPSGVVDTSFGNGGHVVMRDVSTLRTLLVDAAGNAYLVGNGLVKLDPSGQRVPAFGAGLGAESAALDASGNLYLALDKRITKVDPGGAPVAGFGLNGTTTIAQDTMLLETASAVRLDHAGNLYYFGNRGDGSGVWSTMLAKIDASGRLVTSFGQGGRLVFPPGGSPFGFASGAAIDSRGHIVVLGGVDAGAVVAKLDADGRAVTAFGNSGVSSVLPCRSGRANNIALDQADNIYVAMTCDGAIGKLHVAVAKLTRDGRLDPSFGGAGIKHDVLHDAASHNSFAMAVAVRGADVYVAGHSVASPATCGSDFVVAKLDANGAHVSRFGSEGVGTYDLGGHEGVHAIAFNGRHVYLGGDSLSTCPQVRPAQDSFAVVRLLD